MYNNYKQKTQLEKQENNTNLKYELTKHRKLFIKIISEFQHQERQKRRLMNRWIALREI